jgi:hypothetical protein
MTPSDPFGESGYARVGPSGKLQPLTPNELGQMESTVAYWPDRDHAVDHDHCFLCGSLLTTDIRSEEHVFPKWLLRDLDLWEQVITLLNGTTIPYASLKIPACKSCNNFWLSQIEDKAAAAFRAGPHEVASLDQTLLALWLAKVYYGIHFKELALALDRRNPQGPSILAAEDLRRLRDLHHIMQALRRRVRFTRPLGSVVVLRAQVPDELRLRFDYRDARNVAFVAMRIGPTVVIASLLGWGAVTDGMRIKSVETARQMNLHPIQFAEVAASVGYAAAQFIGEFMYSVHHGPDCDVLEPVLIRAADEPAAELFAPMSVRESAEVQAAFMQLPLEDVYDEENDLSWTSLTTSAGAPAPISLETVPIGVEIITPLRKTRDAVPTRADADAAGRVSERASNESSNN